MPRPKMICHRPGSIQDVSGAKRSSVAVRSAPVTAAGRKQLAEQRDEWAKFAGALATILKVT